MCFYLLWIISAKRYWKKCNSHFPLRGRLQWCAELSVICVSSHDWASPGGSAVKNLPAMQEVQETWVWYPRQEDPLEEGLATHPSILAWRIPRTQEPSGLQSMGSQRVGHRWSDWAHTNAPVMIILGLIWEDFSYSCRKTWTVRKPLSIAWKTLSMQKWEVKLKPELSSPARTPSVESRGNGKSWWWVSSSSEGGLTARAWKESASQVPTAPLSPSSPGVFRGVEPWKEPRRE